MLGSQRKLILRFSLRAVFAIFVVLGIASAWFSYELRRAHKQKEYVGKIEELGGYAFYSWETLNSNRSVGQRSRIRDAVAGLLGRDFLATVDGIDLAGCGMKGDDLRWLAEFPSLEYLRLANTNISDAGVSHLTPLGSLRRLDLSRTSITDASAGYLITMTELRLLYVYDTDMSSRGVAELRSALPNCQVVFNAGTEAEKRGEEDGQLPCKLDGRCESGRDQLLTPDIL